MGKNAIVGQSGGPTSVINASLAGVFESCKSRGAQVVYGMCNGVAVCWKNGWLIWASC